MDYITFTIIEREITDEIVEQILDEAKRRNYYYSFDSMLEKFEYEEVCKEFIEDVIEDIKTQKSFWEYGDGKSRDVVVTALQEGYLREELGIVVLDCDSMGNSDDDDLFRYMSREDVLKDSKEKIDKISENLEKVGYKAELKLEI